MTSTKSIEIEGYLIDVTHTYNKEEKPTYDHPGAPASVTVYSMWANLLDDNKNIVRVDVYRFLMQTGVISEAEVEQEILNSYD